MDTVAPLNRRQRPTQARNPARYWAVKLAAAAASAQSPITQTLVAPLHGVTVVHFADYEQAASWFEAEQAVLLAAATQAAGNRMDAYCCHISRALGPYLHRKGRSLERLALCRTALSAAQRLGDPVILGLTTCDTASACAQLGDFSEATARISDALELFASLGDQANEAFARRTQARILHMQGLHDDAFNASCEALRVSESCDDHAGAAYAENGIGWALMLLGRHAEVLPHGRRAVELHRESGSLSGTADSLDTMAYSYLGLGEIGQARLCWQQALAIYDEIEDPRGRIGSLTGLGDAHLAAADIQAARQCWQEALAAIQDLPNADPQPVMNRLSKINMNPP